MLFTSEMYDAYIRNKLEMGWSCEKIKLLGGRDDEGFKLALEELIEDDNWSDKITISEWSKYVDSYRKLNPIPIEIESGTIGDVIDDSLPSLLKNPESSWKALKQYFSSDAGLSQKSISDIEESGYNVLQRISSDTRESGSVKGLVFGSVQSGKTANMEALISMAADTYWNIFIVLSGTIENLRIQTRDRFASDLKETQSIFWKHLDLANEDKDFPSSNLRLNTKGDYTYGVRYVITCLKQKRRLTKLINWLYADPDKARRMRVIVIDDEADQASINTATILDGEDAEQFEQNRKEINRLIVCLANGLMADGTKPAVKIQAINYISYTATPYANVLNEAPGESLFPKNFVHSLSTPNEYFGVNVIFGNPECVDDEGNSLSPGLDVVRTVPEADAGDLKEAHDDGWGVAPGSLKKAICWFLCCAGALRTHGHKKPISMLVNTSNRGIHHTVDYQMIKTFLSKTSRSSLLESCRKIYNEEKSRFSYDDFARDFSSYGLLDKMERRIPEFSSIIGEINDILDDVGNIMFAGDELFEYSTGINICIDNCYSDSEAPDDVKMRIVYPDKQTLNNMEKAPVFIVIGGNTLARGLTIEGLVCTYFTRSSNQADTLMQMGRWFGYRKGYELLQRIWMTNQAKEKFRALSKVEMNLKSEIKRFEEQGLKPEQLGIKVRTMPEVARFTLSSKRKMQMAEPCGYDFTGYTYEITEFDENPELLQNNLDLTARFLRDTLERAGEPTRMGNAVVWTHLGTKDIIGYISSFSLSMHSGISREDIEVFSRWLTEMDGSRIEYWDVAVAGKTDSPSGTWSIGEVGGLPRVERSRISKVEGWIDIGSLRSGADALCDIDETSLDAEQKKILYSGGKNKNAVAKRARLGMEKVPLLLIYRMDSASTMSSKTRSALGTDLDVMSFSVIIPGDKHAGGNVSAVWIKTE